MQNNKLILCVGVCVLDIIHVVKKFPEEDSDTRSNHGRWQRGGNASNMCTVLNLLGEKSEFLGSFSTQKMFNFVICDMIDRGIEISNCSYHSNCEPPISSVLLNESNGTRTIIHSNPNLKDLTFDDFKKIDLKKYKWIHFEARTAIETIPMIKSVVEFNELQDENSKIIISIDLEKCKIDNIYLSEYADFIYLGRDFALFLGWHDMKTSVYELRDKIKKQNTIICPWGAEGIALLDSTNKYVHYPVYKQDNIVDTLGAGDTFCASSIFSLAKGDNLDKAIKFGCKIAGIKIGFFGYDEIKNIIL